MNGKRDLKFIVIGVVFLFIIAGCKGGDESVAIAGTTETPFLGGNNGLEIKFLDGYPPEEVTDRDFPFKAIVSLKNIGEYDALTRQLVKVDLIGFLPSDFNIANVALIRDQNPQNQPTPRKKDPEGNIIDAAEVFVTFPSTGEFKFNGRITGNAAFVFRADVCYRYSTDAVSELCILDNMVDPPSEAICSPTGTKEVFSSASPLQVEAFKQNVVGTDKIQFGFDIVHTGSGDVFRSAGSTVDCPKDTSNRRSKQDDVKVTVDTGLPNLECAGLETEGGAKSGYVKLTNGKRRITCTQTLTEGRKGDFIKNIQIALVFDYADSVDKKVRVKHLIG